MEVAQPQAPPNSSWEGCTSLQVSLANTKQGPVGDQAGAAGQVPAPPPTGVLLLVQPCVPARQESRFGPPTFGAAPAHRKDGEWAPCGEPSLSAGLPCGFDLTLTHPTDRLLATERLWIMTNKAGTPWRLLLLWLS